MNGELVVGIVGSSIGGLSLLAVVTAIEVGRRSALRTVEEERRARIDASAPRVVVRELRPDWPPVLPGPSAGLVHPLNDRHVFNMPGNAKQEILLICHAELVNEGTTSAFVALPKGCVKVGEPGQEPEVGSPEYLALANGRSCHFTLPPGDSAWVLIRAGLTVKEWTEQMLAAEDGRGQVSVEVMVRDQFADGVEDSLVVDVRAKPLAQSEDNPNTWRLSTPLGHQPFVDVRKAEVRRTVRRYWR